MKAPSMDYLNSFLGWKPLKDFGPDAETPITIRAKYIEIAAGGELWIGSRQCRYQGKADIVLYGNKEDMTATKDHIGEKYLHTDTGGTLEIHGKWKKSWTKAWFESIHRLYSEKFKNFIFERKSQKW